MDLRFGVEGVDFPLVSFQVLGVEVADVDGFGAVVGEVVSRSATDAKRRVAAGYDDDFVLRAAVRRG